MLITPNWENSILAYPFFEARKQSSRLYALHFAKYSNPKNAKNAKLYMEKGRILLSYIKKLPERFDTKVYIKTAVNAAYSKLKSFDLKNILKADLKTPIEYLWKSGASHCLKAAQCAEVHKNMIGKQMFRCARYIRVLCIRLNRFRKAQDAHAKIQRRNTSLCVSVKIPFRD